jgi:chromosomal replication initiator protein
MVLVGRHASGSPGLGCRTPLCLRIPPVTGPQLAVSPGKGLAERGTWAAGDVMTQDVWVQVRDQMRTTVGPNNYAHWIEPIEFGSFDQGVATFHVPTAFIGTYVDQNFGELIRYQLGRAGLPAQRLSFVPIQALRRGTAQSADAALPELPETEEQTARLDPRLSFDTFVVGKPNELAYAAARRVAEGGPVSFNPLFLYGGVGLGKTHLMHAIAQELRQRQPDANVLYLSAETFMYRFINALRERKMFDFKQEFRSVDVLLVDDIQFFAGKDSTQEEFFHTFNALVDMRKQIVLSADRAPGEIKDLEDRIKSRLQSGLVVDLHPTDYELRLGVLHSKAALYRQEYPGFVIRDGVLEFLAHRISTNIRVLEGALTRLYAFGSLVGRDITLDLAQDCLADILRQSDRKITIDEIQRKVSDHYNIRMSDLIGPKRLRSYARPRQVAMYLAKTLTNRSLPEIGRKFGGRDHTTVMHGVRKIEELRATDAQIADDLELLRRSLEG